MMAQAESRKQGSKCPIFSQKTSMVLPNGMAAEAVLDSQKI